jgi:hypothetical protein
LTRKEILRILRTTPDVVSEVASGLAPSQLGRKPKDGAWSMGEILAHHLMGERDVILPRLKRMRREDAPVCASSVVDRTGFAAIPASRDFTADLAAFRDVRLQTIAFLQSLADQDWQRIGTTPTRGTLMIEGYAQYLAEHDLEHTTQFRSTHDALFC